MSLKIISWNVRGVVKDGFRANFDLVYNLHRPDIMFLLETHASIDVSNRIGRNLGFPNQVFCASLGASGGIWMLFDGGNIDVEILSVYYQCIHAKISRAGMQSWVLSGAYVKPTRTAKDLFWDTVFAFAWNNTLPWCLTGNFNDILSITEKRGSLPATFSRCQRFRNSID